MIRNVRKEEADYGGGPTDEYVLYIEGQTKGIRLNKTNARVLAEVLGTPHTEQWAGRTVLAQGNWSRSPRGDEVYTWRFVKQPAPGPGQTAMPGTGAPNVPQNQGHQPAPANNQQNPQQPAQNAAPANAAPAQGNGQQGGAWPPPAATADDVKLPV